MTQKSIDGKALVYCEKAFTTTNGKTAHGLIRFTERYEVVGLIDSTFAGLDAGTVLDGKANQIPIFGSLKEALNTLKSSDKSPQSLVMGLAPDGGRLPQSAKADIKFAITQGLNIDSGLHDFLSDDKEIKALAQQHQCRIRDVRKTPDRKDLHFFSGKIEKVDCLKLAVLGTDSAIGKRTTAWFIVHAFRAAGYTTELIGTGQTAWMQGAKYSMIMDSLINDFVSGEIEHAVYEAWKNEGTDVVIIEGQGSLMNPAYPGGFEILAAGRPDYVIVQHAPKRLEYDGFPGYPLHPIQEQIQAIEIISGKKVIAITINHEGMQPEEIQSECDKVAQETGLPTFDVLAHGAEALVDFLKTKLNG